MKDTGQFVGQLMQDNGSVVNAICAGLRGKNALGKLFMDAQRRPFQYKIIVEPEIIAPGEIVFRMNLEELYAYLKNYSEDEQATIKLRPPLDMRVLIRGEFIVSGDIITEDEYEAILTIVDYAKVEDIYKHSTLSESQVTRALIGLRKKGALKVVSLGT
jgi:hypothetical protein